MIGSGNPGLPTLDHTQASLNRHAKVVTRSVPAVGSIDSLTGQQVGLHAWSTGSFTGASEADFNGMLIGITNRIRVRRIIWMMTNDAAISGGSAEVALQLTNNDYPTGIDWVVFVPTVAVLSTAGMIAFQMDLGDGWVGNKGTDVSVISSATLTTGQFRVVLLGNEEPAD